MRILHVIPESAVMPRFLYSGSTKDILGRVEYFKSRSLDFEQLVVKRSDESLLESLKSMTLSDYSIAIIEFPIYPKSMEYIRRKAPQLKLYCRSINAELYHKIHLYLSYVSSQRRDGTGILKSLFMHLPVLQKTHLKFKQDYRCGNLSDVLLSITDWETKNYWRYLVGKKAETLPYYLPKQFEDELLICREKKENICISFMGVKVKKGSFLADSLDNFSNLVRLMKDDFKDWSFKVTGELPVDFEKLPARIEPTGFVETPYPLLARSRAVAILSPYGMGFKTKILESILAGCYILLPVQLKMRLPNVIHPFCIEVNSNSVDSFKQALLRCLEPFPSYNLNAVLREEAFRVLDGLFQ